jgi:hypothetical protein
MLKGKEWGEGGDYSLRSDIAIEAPGVSGYVLQEPVVRTLPHNNTAQRPFETTRTEDTDWQWQTINGPTERWILTAGTPLIEL